MIAASGAGLIAPLTAQGFAAAVLHLLTDPDHAASMAARGPPWVRTNRDYAAMAPKLAEVYRRLAASTGRK